MRFIVAILVLALALISFAAPAAAAGPIRGDNCYPSATIYSPYSCGPYSLSSAFAGTDDKTGTSYFAQIVETTPSGAPTPTDIIEIVNGQTEQVIGHYWFGFERNMFFHSLIAGPNGIIVAFGETNRFHGEGDGLVVINVSDPTGPQPVISLDNVGYVFGETKVSAVFDEGDGRFIVAANTWDEPAHQLITGELIEYQLGKTGSISVNRWLQLPSRIDLVEGVWPTGDLVVVYWDGTGEKYRYISTTDPMHFVLGGDEHTFH